MGKRQRYLLLAAVLTCLIWLIHPDCVKAATNIKQTGITATSATIQWDREFEEVSYEIYAWIPKPVRDGSETDTIYERIYCGSTTGTSFTINGLVGGFNSKVVLQSFDDEEYLVKEDTTEVETLPGKVEVANAILKFGSGALTKTSSKNGVSVATNFNLYVDVYSQENVDGYQMRVYTLKGKEVGKVDMKNSKSSQIRITSKNMTETTYCAKVRAYKKYQGKTYYGGWSSKCYAIRQPRCQGMYDRRNYLAVRWETIEGATSYDVYASTKKNQKSFKKVATVKKTNLTLISKVNKKKIKKGKTYYVYVIAKMKKGGKTNVSARTHAYTEVKL